MITAFVALHVTDVVDILLVAYLLYRLYVLFRGTSAFHIFVAIFFLFVFWMVVKALNMELMTGIMKQVFSLGLVALVVLFQPEIRRSLSRLGAHGLKHQRSWREWLFPSSEEQSSRMDAVVEACVRMSAVKQGALIVIAGEDDLGDVALSGDQIDASLVPRLVENIFFKNSPLHDGAMIVAKDRIVAVRCQLPLSESQTLAPRFGMRHRAALGISEKSDAKAVVVSEETGEMALAVHGVLYEGLSAEDLKARLNDESSAV